MKKKTKYSHGGCNECKKRSIKCDETKPKCRHCSRKGHECVYSYDIFVYQPNKRFKRSDTRKTKKEIIQQVSNTGDVLSSMQPSDYAITRSIRKFQEAFLEENHFAERPTIDDNEASIPLPLNFEILLNSKPKTYTVPSFVENWVFEFEIDEYNRIFNKVIGKRSKPYTDYFDENDPDVQLLIWLTFTKSKSIYNYSLVIDDSKNYISKWFFFFARLYPIVGYVVNAVTANLFCVKEKDARWDFVRRRTMQSALDILSCGVYDCHSFEEMTCYLMSTMFLFSERSAKKTDTWRLHLTGALGILQKCELMLSSSEFFKEDEMVLHMYSFAKNWFITAETTACLSAPNGGSIRNISEASTILSYSREIEEEGFIYAGFNLLKCYSQSLTPVFVELIKISMDLRARGVTLSGASGILHDLQLDQSYKEKAFELLQIVDLTETSKMDVFKIDDIKKRARMKACNICHCNALRAYIYAVLLDEPIYGRAIQECVQTIAEQLLSIADIKYYGLAVHWPVFIAGMCSPPGSHRRAFIDTLKIVTSNGTFVARNTIERLERAWLSIDNGDIINEENYDCIAC
ncbi:uncharacterized protein PRCAT00000023001 [Priceomyces carsonii]|uniref:uncharacterized protein n=1 Tax=Priceomyces carsonii TaxID=28549 RepID=UPI002ED8C93E|nr:unnamed protein product [Priceomyces carsonii]